MLGTNIGIDLGTTTIRIFVEGKGIVVSEPSAVAFDTDTGRLLAVGQKASDMIGRNPDSITVVKPMRSGVISDFTATKAIVRVLLYKVCKNMVFKPNIVVCMPSTVTNLEKRTILDLVTAAGAGRACLIEEPLAAALGAGLDISRPMGTMVIDIGGGTADIAVVTMGSISISKSVKIAGNILDEDIIRYLRRERNIVIGEKTAEEAAQKLYMTYQPEVLVLTQGSRGGILLDEKGMRHYDCYKVDVKDSNGCGDTFHGAFVAAKIKGMTNDQACKYASAAAAIKCTRLGARYGMANDEECRAFLQERGVTL